MPDDIATPTAPADLRGTPEAVASPSLFERRVALAVAAIAAFVVLLNAERLWFFSDVWPTLTERDLGTIRAWIKPHGGHWLIPATVGSKVSLQLFEDDFYPWYFIPRVVFYGALSYAWWRVLRWREVPSIVAIACLAFVSWLGSSGWIITVVYIGPLVVGLCALGAAWIVDSAEPTTRRQVELFLLLVIAVSGSASGPALWAAVAVVTMFTGRLKEFVLPIGVSGAIYAGWYLVVARNDPSPLTPKPPGFGDIIRAPKGMAELIGQGLAMPFGLGDGSKYLLFVGFVLLVAGLWRAGRLRSFDAIILTTGVIIVALGVLIRGTQGIRVDAPNRVYLVAAYLLIGLLPALFSRLPKMAHFPVAAIMLLLAIVNLGIVNDEINVREGYISADRLEIETTLALLDRGDALIPWAGVSPQAANRMLDDLVSRGWKGEIHPEVLDVVYSETLLALYNSNSGQGTPLTSVEPVNDAGCISMAGQTAYTFGLSGPGGVVLQEAQGETLTIERMGAAPFVADRTVRVASQGIAYSLGPDRESEIAVRGSWPADQTRSLCGVASPTS